MDDRPVFLMLAWVDKAAAHRDYAQPRESLACEAAVGGGSSSVVSTQVRETKDFGSRRHILRGRNVA